MAIPVTIRKFLDARMAHYDVLEHPPAETTLGAAGVAYVPAEQLLATTALEDRRGALVVLHPAADELNLGAVNRQLGRDLRPMDVTRSAELFGDCDPPLIPALAAAYGIKTLVGDTVRGDMEVFFRASHTEMIRMRAEDLIRIQQSWHGSDISQRIAGLEAGRRPVSARLFDPAELRTRVQQVSELPAMPQMAQRILQLRANPYASARDLVGAIELDPSLAAQLMRYARSPFFGYRGEIRSVHDAIARVLGYDVTMNIALGIAIGADFNNPPDGRLGLRSFWRDSLYCAALCQVLARSLPHHLRPNPGVAYLAGMLHNFGILLLGHLFAPEFYWLNKAAGEQPTLPLPELETRLLGVTHLELGAWLLEHWGLPAEIITTVAEHHSESYTGPHAIYPQLVLIANRLLRRAGVGEAERTNLPAAMIASLELNEDQAVQLLTGVLDGRDDLDTIARQLAA